MSEEVRVALFNLAVRLGYHPPASDTAKELEDGIYEHVNYLERKAREKEAGLIVDDLDQGIATFKDSLKDSEGKGEMASALSTKIGLITLSGLRARIQAGSYRSPAPPKKPEARSN